MLTELRNLLFGRLVQFRSRLTVGVEGPLKQFSVAGQRKVIFHFEVYRRLNHVPIPGVTYQWHRMGQEGQCLAQHVYCSDGEWMVYQDVDKSELCISSTEDLISIVRPYLQGWYLGGNDFDPLYKALGLENVITKKGIIGVVQPNK